MHKNQNLIDNTIRNMKMDENDKIGCFYAVGTGPGDSELLTLKAVKILKQVKWVFVLESPGERSRALEISEPYIEAGNIVKNPYPTGKDSEARNAFWEELVADIKQKLLREEDVAFLTGGDPQIFSAGQSIQRRLKRDIPESHIKTIPGVTSYSAAAALANLPLLQNDEKMAVIQVKSEIDSFRDILRTFESVVFLGVADRLEELIDILDEEDLLAHSFFAAKAGLPDQFTTFDLKSLQGQKKRYRSLIIVKRKEVKNDV